MLSNWVNMLKYIGICEAVGMAGSLFTSRSIPTWYAMLHKPSIAPPSWVFGPVWTILYALMGISASIISQKENRAKSRDDCFYLR